MKIHSLWILLALAVTIYSVLFDQNMFQAFVTFMATCFCVLFWYLAEIRALLQDRGERR